MVPRFVRASLCVAASAMVPGCTSSVVREAANAESDGRVISNQMMAETYPMTFRPGFPPYLERDYEAGADFICDQIKLEYKRDICSEPKINWRR